VAYYFVEPERLKLALSIANWSKPPWYRKAHYACDVCSNEYIYIFVSTKQVSDELTEHYLAKELVRRGWRDNGEPWGHNTRRDICPGCVGARSV
jgi:hypothetical protein